MTTKMDPKVKELWLDALRSGEYEQGVGLLREVGGGYCCLGVLCDIAVKQGIIEEPGITKGIDTDGGITDAYVYGYDLDGEDQPTRENAVYLPDAVADWSGVSRHGDRPAHENMVFPPSLASMNDEGKSFDEIADVIEAEF